jgi:hypothetical protein
MIWNTHEHVYRSSIYQIAIARVVLEHGTALGEYDIGGFGVVGNCTIEKNHCAATRVRLILFVIQQIERCVVAITAFNDAKQTFAWKRPLNDPS